MKTQGWSRLAVGALVLVGLGGCNTERKAPPAPKSRSLSVQATATVSVPEAPPTVAHAPQVKRRLCEGQLTQSGRDFPKPKLLRKAAPGAANLASELVVGGRWTWINFWAAWCVPCKEEIPRLVAWEQKLNQSGASVQLAFVSLDDDERQLEAFLGSQSGQGLRSTYWFKDPDDRAKWLARVGAGNDPDLPLHLLIDPKGKIRCVIDGALDDSDYPQVQALLGH